MTADKQSIFFPHCNRSLSVQVGVYTLKAKSLKTYYNKITYLFSKYANHGHTYFKLTTTCWGRQNLVWLFCSFEMTFNIFSAMNHQVCKSRNYTWQNPQTKSAERNIQIFMASKIIISENSKQWLQISNLSSFHIATVLYLLCVYTLQAKTYYNTILSVFLI